jgi:3-oxoacyl-[acyl-carrier protein] reductase
MFTLKDRVALVTGASQGIGRATALGLAQAGARVVAAARNAEKLAGVVAEINAAGGEALAVTMDVADAEQVKSGFRQAIEKFGKLDILVNNAAITRDTLLVRMKPEDWDAVIATNLTAVFRLCKACVRHMMKERRGRIVNLTSVVGVTGNPGQANYAAAKAGLLGFSKSLARELASRGITVNAVAPGFIDTDMTRALSAEQRQALLAQIPAGHLGSPADVAAAVLFLVSAQAAYITGETLHVNGGMYMP